MDDEFKECRECAGKTGSPLCESCLYNRALVNLLKERLTIAELKLELNRRQQDLRGLEAELSIADTPEYRNARQTRYHPSEGKYVWTLTDEEFNTLADTENHLTTRLSIAPGVGVNLLLQREAL